VPVAEGHCEAPLCHPVLPPVRPVTLCVVTGPEPEPLLQFVQDLDIRTWVSGPQREFQDLDLRTWVSGPRYLALRTWVSGPRKLSILRSSYLFPVTFLCVQWSQTDEEEESERRTGLCILIHRQDRHRKCRPTPPVN
jgi:hypothetical protein